MLSSISFNNLKRCHYFPARLMADWNRNNVYEGNAVIPNRRQMFK